MIFHSLHVPQLIHSPTEMHFGCFQDLAIKNKPVINNCVQAFVWTEVSTPLRNLIRRAIAGSYELANCLPQWLYHFAFQLALNDCPCYSIFSPTFDVQCPGLLWPLDAKSWLIRKDLEAGNDWGQEEKGKTENEMIWWPHPLNGHEFEQTPGDSEGQGSLAYCSPWGYKESDMTDQLKSNNRCVVVSHNYFVLKTYAFHVLKKWAKHLTKEDIQCQIFLINSLLYSQKFSSGGKETS